MTTVLFELPNQTVMDDGTIVLSYEGCIELAKRNKDFHAHFVKSDGRFDHYNRFSEKPVIVFSGQKSESKNTWRMPPKYRDMDVRQVCLDVITEKGLGDKYIARMDRELKEFEKRNMTDALRFIKFFTDVLKEKDMMWGVGRGSSCASLLLYLLGVNRIDPVLFDIPLEEFLR